MHHDANEARRNPPKYHERIADDLTAKAGRLEDEAFNTKDKVNEKGAKRIASILSRSGATPEETRAGVKELGGGGQAKNYNRLGSPKLSSAGQRAQNLVRDFKRSYNEPHREPY
jgi:hypothetical protein